MVNGLFLFNGDWTIRLNSAWSKKKKIAVPARENGLCFRLFVGLVLLVRCVETSEPKVKAFLAPKLDEKYRKKLIGQRSLAQSYALINQYG